MRAKNELFELVKSLNKTEKRYFRVYFSKEQASKIYMKLFDSIGKVKSWDEAAFKEKNKSAEYMKNYQFNKFYLYKLIIKCLADYHEEKTVDAKMHTMIMQCKILFDKALYRQYFKAIDNAKKFALKHEKYGYYLQVLDMEKIIIRKEEVQTLKSEAIYNEAHSSINHLKNIFELSRLASRLLLLYREHGVTRDPELDNAINEVMKHPIMRTMPETLSSREAEAYYRINEIINDIKGDYPAMLQALKHRHRLIENDPHPFKNYVLNYRLDVLSSIIHTSLKLNRFDDAEKYLEIYEHSPKVTDSEIADFEILLAHARFLIHFKKNEYAIAARHITMLENILTKYHNKILIDTELLIRYNFVKFFTITGDYERALVYSNSLSSHPLLDKRADLENYLRILNLIIHFDLGNYELLKYLLISTYRFLYKKKKLYRLELLIMEFIRKLTKIKNDGDLITGFKKLKTQFAELKKDNYEKNAFEYFDFLEWINKKVKN